MKYLCLNYLFYINKKKKYHPYFQVSPVDTEEMDFLSTADNDDTQPSSGISPFTVTGGFEDGVSPSPSELDPIEDQTPVSSLFS